MFPNINNMKIYLICGKTDLRKGIDGLAALVTEAFSLDAYDNAIFLFCGTPKSAAFSTSQFSV